MKYIIIALLVTGCSLFERKPEPPIIQSKCLGKRPVKPTYSFEQLSVPKSDLEAADAVKQLFLDFQAADQYGLDWETAASGCM